MTLRFNYNTQYIPDQFEDNNYTKRYNNNYSVYTIKLPKKNFLELISKNCTTK